MIDDGETNRVEFKVAHPRPSELAERICGLANAEGGYIIIGVEDKTLQVVGLVDPGSSIDTLHRAVRMLDPALAFEPVEPEVYVLNGKKLVVARVPFHFYV